jgi:hypothetical protein
MIKLEELKTDEPVYDANQWDAALSAWDADVDYYIELSKTQKEHNND